MRKKTTIIICLIWLLLGVEVFRATEKMLADYKATQAAMELENLHAFCIDHRYADAMIVEGVGYCKTFFISLFDGAGGYLIVTEEYLKEFDADQAGPSS